MTKHDLSILDHASHTAHEWVSELAGRLDWSSQKSALRLLRTTLHLVRDHLLVDELAQFSAQLPLLIRGMLFEGWVPKRTPSKDRSAEGFLRAIEEEMGDTQEYRGSEDLKYVFELLNAHLTAGEIEDVRSCLPGDIRAFWPAP